MYKRGRGFTANPIRASRIAPVIVRARAFKAIFRPALAAAHLLADILSDQYTRVYRSSALCNPPLIIGFVRTCAGRFVPDHFPRITSSSLCSLSARLLPLFLFFFAMIFFVRTFRRFRPIDPIIARCVFPRSPMYKE